MEHGTVYHLKTERVWHNCKPTKTRLPELTGQTRRVLIREAAQRPMVTLEELQISCALNKSGLYGCAKKKAIVERKLFEVQFAV